MGKREQEESARQEETPNQDGAVLPLAKEGASPSTKRQVYENELATWRDLFQATDPDTRRAAEGLIERAAFIRSQCWQLEQILDVSGAVKVHPEHPDLQRTVPAAKEHRGYCDTYANVVNKLNQLRLRNVLEEEDDLDEFK